MDQLLIYIGYWVIFGFIHSILALEQVKRLIPLSNQMYRILYNVIALMTLLWVLSHLPSITSLIIQQIRALDSLFFLLFMVIGGIISLFGVLAWDIPAFLGLSKSDRGLQTNGIFAISRHPVYLGIIIILLSTLFIEISTVTLSWIIGCGGYFVIGTISEELHLEHAFENYWEYKKQVGRFFPFLPKHFLYLKQNIA